MYYGYNYVRLNGGVDRPYYYEARVSTQIVYICHVTPSVTGLPRHGVDRAISSKCRRALGTYHQENKSMFPYSHK